MIFMTIPCREDESLESFAELQLRMLLPKSECSIDDTQTGGRYHLHVSRTSWPATSHTPGHWAERWDSVLRAVGSAGMIKESKDLSFTFSGKNLRL